VRGGALLIDDSPGADAAIAGSDERARHVDITGFGPDADGRAGRAEYPGLGSGTAGSRNTNPSAPPAALHRALASGHGHLGIVSSGRAAPGLPPSFEGPRVLAPDPAAAPGASMAGAATGNYGGPGGHGGRSEAPGDARADTSRWDPALGATCWVPAAWVIAEGNEPPAVATRSMVELFSGGRAAAVGPTAGAPTAGAPAVSAMGGAHAQSAPLRSGRVGSLRHGGGLRHGPSEAVSLRVPPRLPAPGSMAQARRQFPPWGARGKSFPGAGDADAGGTTANGAPAPPVAGGHSAGVASLNSVQPPN